jgi:hypothetical protein
MIFLFSKRRCPVYFDRLTIVSMIIFAVAFGSFVYACVIRGFITDSNDPVRDERGHDGKGEQGRDSAE